MPVYPSCNSQTRINWHPTEHCYLRELEGSAALRGLPLILFISNHTLALTVAISDDASELDYLSDRISSFSLALRYVDEPLYKSILYSRMIQAL